MKKEDGLQKQQEALKLFLEGVAKHEIARRLNISTTTVKKWSRDKDWDGYYKEMEKKTAQYTSQTVAEEKKRSLRIIQAIEAKYAQQLQDKENQMEIKTSDFAQVQKVKWDILTPRNIQQLNLLKQDNINIGLSEKDVQRLLEVLDEQ